MNRTQIVLSVTLIAQLVLIFALRTHDAETAGLGQPRPLLPAMEKLEAKKITLSSKDGGSLTLVKNGDQWSIEQAGGYPADPAKVKKLLDDLRGLKVRTPVVTGSRYHAALEVTDDEARARVTVWADPEKEPAVDLLFGKSSGSRATNVRLAGEDDVWEVGGIASYDVRPAASAWIDTKLVGASADSIVGIRVENTHGAFAIGKEGETWKVTGPEGGSSIPLSGDNVDALVRTAANLTIADPIGPTDDTAQGLANPAARVRLAIGGDAPRDVEILIGGLTGADSNKRYVTKAGSGWTGAIWKSATDRLVDATLESLGETGGE